VSKPLGSGRGAVFQNPPVVEPGLQVGGEHGGKLLRRVELAIEELRLAGLQPLPEGLDLLHLLQCLGQPSLVGRRAALAPLPAEKPLDLREVAQLPTQGDGGIELLLGT